MSKSKAKGTRWESEVVRYLNEQGFPYVERRALCGTKDCGDLLGVPGFEVVECKALAQVRLPSIMNEVDVELLNVSRLRGSLAYYPARGVAVLKRPGHPTRDGYVVMDLHTFASTLEQS